MLTEKEKKVKEILLMPIECTSQDDSSVFLHHNRIYTNQNYNKKYKKFDQDMSHLAVEFYQKIYREKLNKLNCEILDEDGTLKRLEKHIEFCGDTMNSFNTIEKKIKNSEKKEKLKERYHCLANFWLLPMDVGHSSLWTKRRKLDEYSKSENGLCDYMDRFLEYYMQNYDKYKNEFPEYSKQFNPKNIGKDHFLEGIYVINNKVVEGLKFSNKEPDDIADEMCNRIEKRAELIAHEKCDDLYSLFKDFGII